MIDNLINLVKEHAGDAIINNPQVPNEKNDAVISETANSIMNSLKNQFSGGNAGGLADMFNQGTTAANPVTGKVSQNVTDSLKQKFGLTDSAAGNIVSSLIPVVMSQFVKKTNDPNDNSFTMDGIMKSISGTAGAGDILGSVKGMFGGKQG